MIVLASSSYSDQSAINTNLDTLQAATAIRTLFVEGKTQGEKYAAAWAATNGVPVVYMAEYLDGAGYIYSNKGLAVMQVSKATRMLTCGTSARINAAIASAVPEGVTVTQI